MNASLKLQSHNQTLFKVKLSLRQRKTIALVYCLKVAVYDNLKRIKKYNNYNNNFKDPTQNKS